MAKSQKHVAGAARAASASGIGRHLERAGRPRQDDVALPVARLPRTDPRHGADVPGRRHGHHW